MRFELLVLLIQMLGSVYVGVRFSPRIAVISFVILLYGPAAALAKISVGSVILPLGSVVALLGIFFTLKVSLPKSNFYYILSLVCVCIVIAVIQSDIYILVMTVHYLIYAVCGLMFGNFVASRSHSDKFEIIRGLCSFATLSFFAVIICRMFLVDGTGIIHSRDVGFGLLPIFILCLTFLSNRVGSLSSVSSIMYLVLSQTRSVLGVLLLIFFHGRHMLLLSVNRALFTGCFLTLAFAVTLLTLTRLETHSLAIGADKDMVEQLNVVSRLNGAIAEWQTFTSSPIIGAGVAFYDEDYRAFKSSEGSSADPLEAIAYNHVGITAVLAQGGIMLFFLTVFLPVYYAMSAKKIVWITEDKLLVGCYLILIGYFASFFLSGSPVRKDYSDSILYYFAIGYLMNIIYSRIGRKAIDID
ncbi:MAG: hypothetical protein P8N61_01285 [Porticoccaceae bacterium]|nr:hypothetical protein [Porticoccaceae bacterium]